MHNPVVKFFVRLAECVLAVAGALLLWLAVVTAMARSPTDPFLFALQPLVAFSAPAIVTFVIASFIRSPRWLFAFALLFALAPVAFVQLYMSLHTPVPEGEHADIGPGIVLVLLACLAAGAVLGAIAKSLALTAERAGHSTTTAMIAQTALVLAVFVLAIVPRLLAVRPP